MTLVVIYFEYHTRIYPSTSLCIQLTTLLPSHNWLHYSLHLDNSFSFLPSLIHPRTYLVHVYRMPITENPLCQVHQGPWGELQWLSWSSWFDRQRRVDIKGIVVQGTYFCIWWEITWQEASQRRKHTSAQDLEECVEFTSLEMGGILGCFKQSEPRPRGERYWTCGTPVGSVQQWKEGGGQGWTESLGWHQGGRKLDLEELDFYLVFGRKLWRNSRNRMLKKMRDRPGGGGAVCCVL